jgi:hypothetical protein
VSVVRGCGCWCCVSQAARRAKATADADAEAEAEKRRIAALVRQASILVSGIACTCGVVAELGGRVHGLSCARLWLLVLCVAGGQEDRGGGGGATHGASSRLVWVAAELEGR